MSEVEDKDKAYVVVRSDMSPGYQIVQTAHAVAEHEAQFSGSMANRTMIVLSVPNEMLLTLLYNHLTHNVGLTATLFWEPDIQGVTAFAISPNELTGAMLKGLPLAGSR